MNHVAISLLYAFVPRHKKEYFTYFAHLKPRTLSSTPRNQHCNVSSGQCRRVRSERRVLHCGCVIALQATSHLPLTLELLLYGYFCVCFAVEVQKTCFWGDIKTAGNGFLPYHMMIQAEAYASASPDYVGILLAYPFGRTRRFML